VSNLPDTKLAVITWVSGHPSLPGGVSVSGAVPDDLASAMPLVAVYRPPGSGPDDGHRWDRTALHFQTWAATEKTAFDTANAVFDIVHEMVGAGDVGGAVVSVTETSAGVGSMPDPGYPDYHRYVFTVTVKARNL